MCVPWRILRKDHAYRNQVYGLTSVCSPNVLRMLFKYRPAVVYFHQVVEQTPKELYTNIKG